MTNIIRLTALVTLLGCFLTAAAQVASPALPVFSDKISLQKIETVALPALEKAQVSAARKVENPLYSLPVGVNFSLENAGTWTDLAGGDRVWHLRIASPEGRGIALFYEDFYLPAGARLFMYDAEKTQVKGAYTSRNNQASGKFFTGFVQSAEVIVEYFEPAEAAGEGRFTIFRADQTVQSAAAEKSALMLGFGTSLDCEVNANCPVGNPYADLKNGVCRVMMTVEEGTAWCTGTLLNNMRNDETPYVLSAFHCTDTYTPLYDLWRFDFHYAGANCENPTAEPAAQSLFGAIFRAGRQDTDFQLVEITEDIPASYGLQFNGWDSSEATPERLTLLHHPSADIQKISLDTHSLAVHPSPLNWNNAVTTPAGYHFAATLDVGTFEIGSSGAAWFDENQRVTAQLHGGFPGCEEATIYGGRLFYSWDSGASDAENLAPWLDPDATGAEFTDALPQAGDETATISGTILTQNGDPVAGVTVRANGNDAMSALTDAQGNYSLELPTGFSYTVSYEKNYNPANGIATSDIVKIRRVVLTYEEYPDIYTRIAGDTNGGLSGPTTGDIVVIRQLILDPEAGFSSGVASWQFIPALYVFPDANNPWTEPIPSGIFVENLTEDVSGVGIVGIKIGDMNDTVNSLD